MAVTELDKHYAAELKKLRKKHRLIQYAMAAHLDLESQQQYSDLEKGKKHFTDDMLIKICAVFHISILQFTHHPGRMDNFDLIIGDEDYEVIKHVDDNETKSAVYKKLFLETKIENIELKLGSLCGEFSRISATPSKYKIHVLI